MAERRGAARRASERCDERDPSADVPSPTALAATWDEELVEELAAGPSSAELPISTGITVS